MVAIAVFVEGGGGTWDASTRCRKGFGGLFAGVVPGHRPRVYSCGTRKDAYDRFALALKEDREFPLLLLDSEDPVAAGTDAWTHILQRDKLQRPSGARDEQAHLMVQCMENWFLADLEAVGNYFGQGFNFKPLPSQQNIELASKPDVQQALTDATRSTKTKGRYEKVRHGFDLVALLAPMKLEARAPHAKQLFDTLRAQAEACIQRKQK